MRWGSMRHSFRPIALCLAHFSLAACASAPVEPVAQVRAEQTGALQLFTALDTKAGAAENVFYSPVSVEQAFGLLHPGAAGETKEQLEVFFGWPKGDGADELLQRQRERLLGHGAQADIRLANALWLSDSFRFRPTYLDDAREYYDATARALDFSASGAPGSAKVINEWARAKTQGLIPEVITPAELADDTAAVLTNALYFEAAWAKKFDGSEQLPFLFGDGSEQPFHLMRETGSYKFVEEGRWQAIRLPYEGGRFAMDVIMPDRRVIMDAAPPVDTVAELASKLKDAEPRLIDLSLPRFEVDFKAGLVDPLKAMGLTLPFDPNHADLSAMAEPGQQQIYVGNATHLTKLQVYEDGTKAAAVTVLRIVLTGGIRYERDPLRVIVDRPFLSVIRDLDSGEVLFLGRIAQPVAFEPENAEEGPQP